MRWATIKDQQEWKQKMNIFNMKRHLTIRCEILTKSWWIRKKMTRISYTVLSKKGEQKYGILRLMVISFISIRLYMKCSTEGSKKLLVL